MKEYTEEDFLLLSGIQHYMFCKRQWALIHIEQKWAENLLTVEGEILHKRAHDQTFQEKRQGVITTRSMPVHSRELGISGQCDIVELIPDESGCFILGQLGKYAVVPVEYKRGKEKPGPIDEMQVVAQAMCLEEMLSCTVSKGYLYYGETRHRSAVQITDETRTRLREICEDMHQLFRKGYTPKVKPHSGCQSCSLKDECLPKMLKRTSVKAYLEESIREVEDEKNT